MGLSIHPPTSERPLEIGDQGPTNPLGTGAVESQLQLKLPKDYKDWLQRFNGGRPEPRHFVFDDPGLSSISLALLFGAGGRPDDELLLENYRLGRFGNSEGVVVPIGIDGEGNWICWTPNGLNEGEVSHVLRIDGQQRYMTKSFTDLLQRLVGHPSDPPVG